jgi:hypothetical protein
MYINLFSMLIVSSLFLVGSGIGYVFSNIFSWDDALTELICGFLSVIFFAWPAYKKIGLLPPLPKCPGGCGCRQYAFLPSERYIWEGRLKCTQCGQLIHYDYKSDLILILDGNEKTTGRLKLRHPKFLGRWKRQ